MITTFDHTGCKNCPLNVSGSLAGQYSYRTADPEASIVVVAPSVPRAQELKRLERIIAEFDDPEIDFTFATKCTGDISGKKQKPKKRAEQRHCRSLSDEWEPEERIYVCLGAEAVAMFTAASVSKTMFGRVTEVTGHGGETYKILPTVTLPQVFFYKESQLQLIEHINLAYEHIQGNQAEFFSPGSAVYEEPDKVLAFIEDLIDSPATVIACDTETNSLNVYDPHFEILMMSFSRDKNVGHTIVLPGEFSNEPWAPDDELRLFELLTKLFEAKKHRWVFHNAAYDTKALARFLELDIQVFEDCVDTMLLAHLTNENRSGLGLKVLAREDLKFEVWDKEVRDWFELPMAIKLATDELKKVDEEIAQRYKTHKSLTASLENKRLKAQTKLQALRDESDSMLEQVKVYAAVDAAATFGLWEYYSSQIADDPWLAYFFKNFLRFYPVTLASVEHSGLQIDEAYFYSYRDRIKDKLARISEAFKRIYFEEYGGAFYENDFAKAYSAVPKEDKELRKTLRDLKKKLKSAETSGQPWTLDDTLDALFEIDEDYAEPFEEKVMETWTLRDQHVEDLIREHFDLPFLARTKTGKLSLTGEVVDEYIEHTEGAAQAFFKLYKVYEDLSKNLSTYVDGFLPHIDTDFKLHGNLLAHGTLTGRLSSRKPNLQNLKKTPDLLRMFTSRFGDEGQIVVADYSQAELRKLAVVSQDRGFLDAYQLGIDLHRLTAAKAFQLDIANLFTPEEDPAKLSADLAAMVETWQRNLAKTLNFGIVYGMQSQGFSRQTGYAEDEAEAFIAEYFKNAPGVLRWIRLTELFALYHGYTQSPLGRKRRIPNFTDGQAVIRKALGKLREVEDYDALLHTILEPGDFDPEAARQVIEFTLQKLSRDIPINILRKDLRAGVNAPIQGGASDLNMRTIYRLGRELRKRDFVSCITNTVHDSIVLDTHKDETLRVVRMLNQISVDPFPKRIWEQQLDGYQPVKFEMEIKVGPNQAELEEI